MSDIAASETRPSLRLRPTADFGRSDEMQDVIVSLREAGFTISDERFVYLPFDSGAWDLAVHVMSDVGKDGVDAIVAVLVGAIAARLRKGKRATTARGRVVIFGPNGQPLREIELALSSSESRLE